MKQAIILFITVLLFPLFSAAQDSMRTDYYTQENILRFADYLYKNGEHARAIGEYGRVMVLCNDSKLKDTLGYRIAVANLELSRPVQVRKACRGIPANAADSLMGFKARSLYAYSFYSEKRYDSSAACASRIRSQIREPEWQLRAVSIETAAYLQQYRWNDAAILAEKAIRLFGTKRDDTLARHLHAIGIEGANLRMKNGAVAALISAVVPGSGKMYAGRGWDGVYSLLMIGVMAWQSYEGYSKDGLLSGRCITFGLLGSAFYAGDIYGSVNAARQYNQSRKQALCDRINLRFEW